MASIKFDIRGDNSNFLRSVQGAQRGVHSAVSAIERAGQGMAGTFDRVKESALGGFKQIAMGMAGITALLESGGFLKGLIDEMSEFTKAMKEVSTLSQDVTRDFEGWKAKVVDMTTQIPIGATEAAKAMYQIESAGHHGADAMNVLAESAKGAIGGATETFTTADAITTILNAYNKSAAEATHISDLLFTTVKLGKTTMGELGRSIAQVAPIASTYGVAIEDVLAAIATLTKSGTPTSIAIRQVRDSIIATTRSLGDSAFEGKRFIDAMAEVADNSNGSNNALREELKTLQAMNGVLGLTGKNAAGAAADLAEMSNSTGAADEAYQKMADTAGNSAQLLKNNIFKALEPIGDEMIGFGKSLSDALNTGFESGATQKFVTVLEGLIATYGLYRAALMATGAVQSLQTQGMVAGYDAQIAELEKLMAAQETKIAADLQERIDNGKMTLEQAILVNARREYVLAMHQQIVTLKELAAASEEEAATAMENAIANKAAADEMMIAANEQLAAAEASGVELAKEAALKDINTAKTMQEAAATELNTAAHMQSVAANRAAQASKMGEVVAHVTNTGAEVAEAGATQTLTYWKVLSKKATDALNASMFASPIFWIAATIAGVTYAVYKLVTAETAHERAVRETNEALDEQAKKLEERKSNIDKLIRIIQTEEETELDKVKAYEELKRVAPEITKEYSRQALATMEATEAQKLLNENMDAKAYENLTKEIEDAENWLRNFDTTLQNSVKNAGQGAGQVSKMLYDQKEAMETKLGVLRDQLAEVERLNAIAAEEERPIEVRIKEAEENAKVKKDILDFWDEAAAKMYELSEWHVNTNFEGSIANLDAYIADVEKKLSDLQKEMDANPQNTTLQLKQSEGQKILNTLLTMRSQWIASGATDLPLMLRFQLQGAHQLAKGQADQAQKEVDKLNAQQKTPAGGGGGKKLKDKKKTTKKTGKTGPTKEEIAYDVKEINKAFEEAVKDFQEDMDDDRTDLMQEVTMRGTELEIAQIKEETKRRKEAYREQFDELVKKRQEADKKIWLKQNQGKKEHQYKPTKSEDEYRKEVSKALGSEGGDYLADVDSYLDQIENRKVGDIQREEAEKGKQAWIDYFKTYGTLAEKRKAAEDEFNLNKERIDHDTEISEEERNAQLASNLKSYEQSLRDIDFEELKQSINWEYIFGDLDNVDTETLGVVENQLEEFIEKSKDLKPDELKTLTDALFKVQEAMDLSRPIEAIKKARQEYAEAKQEYDEYKKKLDQARKEGNTAGEKEALKGMTTASQKMQKAKNKEKVAFESVTGLVDDYAKALDEAGDVIGGAAGQCMKLAASAVSAGVGMADGIKKFGEAASAMEKSVAILAIIEAALKAVQLITQIFGDKADVTLTNYVETIDVYINLLDDSISALNQSMTDTKNTISETISYYEDLIKLQKDQAAAIKSQSEVWLNSGGSKGFLGIGGSHSEGVKIKNQIKESLKSSNQEVRKFYTEGYNNLNEYFKKVHGYYASSVDDFGRLAWLWNLSDEDLIALSKDTKALSLLGDELSGAIVKYAESLQEIKDAQLDEFEALLTVSYDDFYDDFVSMVSDMDNTSADFANNFAQYMRTALIKSLIAGNYKDKIEALYRKAGEWASDEEGLTESRLDLLKKEYLEYAKAAQNDIDMIDKIVGTDAANQQATSKGFSAMSQDTAEELNSRFTALQIAGENISNQIMFVVQYMSAMTTMTTERNQTLMEIRNMVFISNGFLEDIAKYTKNSSINSNTIKQLIEEVKRIL